MRELLQRADACKLHLNGILDFVSAYAGEDLNVISEKLAVALKVLTVLPCVISFLMIFSIEHAHAYF